MAQLKLKFKTVYSFSTLFIFLFVFFTSALPNDDAEAIQEGETTYMLKLMNRLTPTPSTWSHKTHICNWTGVICDSLRFVTFINLRAMSLTGTLPSSLNDYFDFLTTLDLSYNSLSGPLPSLANLERLQEVYLQGNNFTSIPDGCFQGLTGLQILFLRNNFNLVPWELPIDLADSSALKVLDLPATNLMGSLPDIFHSFPNLVGVYLFNNNLSGVLPKSFAQSNISMLWLHDPISSNKMSGTIEVLSSMTNLASARLEGNSFEGPIPDLSNCTALEYLSLQHNQLTGVVPPSLMNLSNLGSVFLDHNFFQGPFPVFKGVTNVSLGDNTSNSFCSYHAGPCDERVTILLEIAAAFGYPLGLVRSWRGNNPCKGWSFVKCGGGNIRTLNFTKLNLTGTMSPAFGSLTDLQSLYLGGNSLHGSIPESLASLPQLELVDVSKNNLSGNIPKFSTNVKFIATGNDFPPYSQAGGATPLSRPWVAGTLGVGVGVIVIFVVIIYSHKRCLSIVQNMMIKKTRTCIDQNVEDFIKSYGCLAPKRYSYTEVKRMTNSFRNKLGQGGYGTVFKATLTDGREAAVKVLSESNGRGEEFINEVASISRTSHVNIVSLLGFCYEMNRRALIYEFMSNGSLDKFICGEGSPTNSICDLNWNTLYKIAIGIARGLEYLHQGCNTRILHLDIKPQNILLDEEFCPKIADFGLAKICKKKESIVSVLGIRGTPGYIAPEVYSRTYGGVSHKSDVYSYGMLMLEVVGARKNYDCGGSNTSEMYFPDWIYKDIEEGNIRTRYLVNTEEENEIVMKITLVSLWCIQPRPLDRPSISKVMEMLEGPIQSVPYPPKPILCSPERPSSNICETNLMTTWKSDSIK